MIFVNECKFSFFELLFPIDRQKKNNILMKATLFHNVTLKHTALDFMR